MKITITSYNKTYSVEIDDDMDVESMADTFKGLLVSMGYHPCNVDELFNTEYKWFTEEERQDNMQGHLISEENVSKSLEDLERLAKDRRVQHFQDNLYKNDDDSVF